MATEVFNIEFKFPNSHAEHWSSFAAKARQSAADVWEVYAVQSYDQTAVPFETKLLIKGMTFWKEFESNRETLVAALVGRAIDTANKRLR